MSNEILLVERTLERQAEVDLACRALRLYESDTCTFCHFVEMEVERLNLSIELFNIDAEPAARQELVEGGGRARVPCLRIEHSGGDIQWLYQAAEIIKWLDHHFGS
ncbi:glutaredoxin family protein [Kushneria aurantia]|uniref:Glutaredoxin family protein n=1 Tax=Kushneria aurantia TaxID=504092 RepID=A0ABV6FZ87_9GAMM|nr:glutaredoxin [Kushneria aurantia]